MKPNIYDIAKQAGVSKSTVSRVLNNQANISETSKEKVLQAISDLDYKPSRIARSLTGAAFNAILALTHRTSETTQGNPFFSDVIQAISAVSEKKEFDLILQTSKTQQEELAKVQAKVSEKMIQGIIILSSALNEDYLYDLDKLGIPIVLIGKLKNDYANIYSIDTDNFNDSRRIVDSLIEHGHSKIACVHAPMEISVSSERTKGYLEALKNHAIPIEKDYLINGGYNLEDAKQAIQRLLSLSVPPTAIFATDAIKSLAVYQICEKKNIAIPDKCSIVGFNDENYSPFFIPPLSGISIPTENLGTKASELLFDLIENKNTDSKEIFVPTNLVVTESISLISAK